MTELTHSTLTDLINNEFVIEHDNTSYAMLLPIKQDGEKMKGSKSSLTVEQLIEYQNTGEVIDQTGKSWKSGVSMEEAKWYELRLRHTNNLVMIDVDGSFGNKGNISSNEFFEIEGLPDWIKDCPYTLSRTKKLPHLLFRLVGIDRNKLSNTYTDCFQLFNGDLLVNHAWEKPDAIVYNYNPECIPEVQYKELIKLCNPQSSSGNKLMQISNEKKFKAKIVNNDDVKSVQGVSDISFTPIPNETLTKDQELLFMIRMPNQKDRQIWLRVCSCIKNNKMTNDDWIRFCKINKLNLDTEKINLFKNINTNYDLAFYYIQSLAKETNPVEYKKWTQKYNVYQISQADVTSAYATSNIIKDTLKNSLVICNNIWYVLNAKNLWTEQKHPEHYIITEITKYLDYSKNILNNKINSTDGEAKKELIKELEDWLKLYKAIEKPSYLSVLKSCLTTTLRDDKFAERLDTNRGELAFQNGIMDLETKVFRNGIMWSDYITKTIPYDYVQCDDLTYIKSVLKKILNNNDEHLEYFLSIIGYSFTGYSDREKSIYFMIDKTDGGRGDNGKTFMFDILTHIFPCYVYKSKAELIAQDNKKAHKQLANTKGMRLVWLEEMPKEKQTNAELLKYIGDGKPFENEVMFGTCEIINMLFKMFALSNHCPKIDPNEQAVYNRYKQVSFNSHFDRTGTRTEDNPEELKFVAKPMLPDIIKKEHYNEVINLVIYYAHRYFTSGIPKIPQQFANDTKETQHKNDNFGCWFSDNCVKDDNSNVALKELVKQSGMSDKDVKEGMERLGFKYNKDLSKGLGKDPHTNKQYKGGYVGVKYNNDDCVLDA